jgi:hypothetical protein
VSLFERYILSCDATGFPIVITHVVSYTTLPTIAELHERVSEAQARLPLLRAYISGAYTRKPAFAVREKPFEPAEIVKECEPIGDEMAVLETELRIMCVRKAGDDTPLWRVAVYPGFVAVSCNHVVADGRGSLALLNAMVAPRDDPLSVYKLAKEDGTHKSYDATVMLRAGIGMLTKSIWRELVIPVLPQSVQRRFTRNDPWPGVCDVSPLGRDWGILAASVDADTLAKLAAVGKQRGIKTLHPMIETAYTAAVWAVFHANKPFQFVSNTPRSDRDVAKGHSAITSLYVSLLTRQHEFRGLDDLWGLARNSATFLRSSAADAVARQTLSMLKFIPDPEPKNDTTGWMKYLTDRASCPSPFFEGIMVSNLGRFQLPPNATDHVWGQASHPSAFAIGANVIGHAKGVRLTTIFWDSVPANSSQIDQMHRVWEKLMVLMADGAEGNVEELTRKCM